jgi:hypothetical protein
MGLPIHARNVPGRLAAGAFIIDQGLGKWSADETTAGYLHSAATGAYPILGKMKPRDFIRLLSASEIALAAILLLPVVPDWLAGAALTGFASAQLGVYARTPGTRKQGSPFPTQQGIPQAKDAWMLGIGLGMVVDGVTDRAAGSS